ncbi:hypothetical protein N402_07810 [Helicobacter pylori FD423]|nr:hypothetical protein N402_07810 [Helicobacter pylori FD423]
MHGANYNIKAFFFFCHFGKILLFFCFWCFLFRLCGVWVGFKTTRLTKIKLFDFVLKSAF